MKPTKCLQCGLVNPFDATACLRCKTTLTADDSYADDPRSLWTTVVEQRYRLVVIIGVVVLALLLNQTQFVSSWFVPKEIATILKDLDQRTEKSKSEKLLAARDRVKALAIDASRGRRKAIAELVNLDAATAGITVPNPVTQQREAEANVTRALGPQQVNGIPVTYYEAEVQRQQAYDPGLRAQYLNRSASIEEYVGDILAHIGEPAVEPIMTRIKAVKDAHEAGDTTFAATMPRELLSALGRIKSPKALDLLIECASAKPYSYNNVLVIEALSFYEDDDPRLVQIYDMALTEAAADKQSTFNSPFAIRAACEGLARIKSQTSLNVLLKHLDAGEWEGKYSYVVQAIARFGKPAVPSVLEVVNSRASTKERQNAVEALGVLKASEARSEVVALLDSPELHAQAAHALAEWNKIETVPDLEAARQRHPEWGWEFDDAIKRIKR